MNKNFHIFISMKIYILEKDNIPFYVGKSCNPLHRFYKHKKNFGDDIKQHIIDDVPDIEWKFWEKYWIEQFKNWGFILLNKNNGGGGPDKGRKIREKDEAWKRKIGDSNKNKVRSETWKKEMSLLKIGKPSPFKGKNHSTNTKILQSNIKKGNIYKKGKSKLLVYIKDIEYDYKKMSIKDLGIKYNTTHSNMWIFLNKNNIFINKQKRSINQYDLNMNYIQNFKSIIEASKTLQIDSTTILNICSGKIKASKNFKFKYNE